MTIELIDQELGEPTIELIDLKRSISLAFISSQLVRQEVGQI